MPADRYFLDFANPYYQIGLELDGAAFHEQEADRLRDQRLVDQGWKIFRVRGAEALRGYTPIVERECWYDPALDEETTARLYTWMMQTCNGVITALDLVFFSPYARDWPPWNLAASTLSRHQLVPSPVPYTAPWAARYARDNGSYDE